MNTFNYQMVQILGGRSHSNEVFDSYHACLMALGHKENLGKELRKKFERELNPDTLRGHFVHIPDFQDDKALECAKELALSSP